MKEVIYPMLTKAHEKVSKIQYNAPVVLTFTFLSFIALGLNILTDGEANKLLFSVYSNRLSDPLTYVRLFTHVLGHVNFEHFFNNFILILLVGPFLEEKYGSKRLFIMIVITAFVTGVMHMVFSKNTMLMGASGIVFMLMLLSSFVNLEQGKIPLTLILCVIVFIGREFVSGFLIEDSISRTTHIFGGLLGALFGFFLNKDRLIKEPTNEIAAELAEPEKNLEENTKIKIAATEEKEDIIDLR